VEDPIVIGNLEIRMAHLEGAYEQINHRLGAMGEDLRGLRAEAGGLREDLRSEIGGVRTELRGEIGGVRTEVGSLREDLRGEIVGVRRELIGRVDRQFFWMMGLLIVSILLPIARSIGH
jgi:hypothetical protein